MTMHNPPHPGELISSMYGRAHSQRPQACKDARGCTPESWLAMQANYDLGKVRSKVDLSRVTPVEMDCPVV